MLMAPGKINSKPEYMGDHSGYYEDIISVMNKGVEMQLVKILTIFIAIDFSNSKFYGEIPNNMGNLKELINQLTGPIPQDRQFGTFQNSSFEGNSGFCGFPLFKKSENIETPTLELNQESSYGEGFSWKVVVMGYASGLVIGLVIGHVIISKRSNNWFTRTLGVNLHM
nr:receptor-like protein 9DC3 [Quercus suber]